MRTVAISGFFFAIGVIGFATPALADEGMYLTEVREKVEVR